MKTIRVSVPPVPGRACDVLIGAGALDALADRLPAAAHYAIIADSNVAPLFGEVVSREARATGVPVDVFVFPAGESAKTREEWARLGDAMLRAGVGRDGCVLALGGGVCGDLAGFVAATYMRGIPCVLLPTSLLAMIDAAIGGKTAIDTPAGKNLVGAFHPPAIVVEDPRVLETLPEPELRAGLAEAVKHGAIADAAYLDAVVENRAAILDRDASTLERLVLRSVEIKAEVVSADPLEAGRRAILNFGHTIGHAIERLADWGIPHGHAVSIGMVAEAELGEALGVSGAGTAERLRSALHALELPVHLPNGMSPAAIVDATASDKKARAGHVRYSLIENPGVVARADGDTWTFQAEPAAVRAALARLTA